MPHIDAEVGCGWYNRIMGIASVVDEWMAGYLRAWESNRPDDIRALFTNDAVYLTAPFVPPREGVEAIVAGWLADRDEPGGQSFTWQLAGVDGDLAFVTGVTDYADPARVYSNLWVIRFADDGRASSYTEWYMRHPD